jgi:prophage maintenance system killer protein
MKPSVVLTTQPHIVLFYASHQHHFRHQFRHQLRHQFRHQFRPLVFPILADMSPPIDIMPKCVLGRLETYSVGDWKQHPHVKSFLPGQQSAATAFREARDFLSRTCDHVDLAEDHYLGSASEARLDQIGHEVNDHFFQYMADCIYGSNMQEAAGLARDETHRLARTVLACRNVDPTEIEQGSEEYKIQEASLMEARGTDLVPCKEDIIQARREVIQHAQALHFLSRKWIHKPRDEPLSEELIKATHKILCEGLPADHLADSSSSATAPSNNRNASTGLVYNIETSTDWAGSYRTHSSHAGSTYFTPPARIPTEMAIFIEDYNADIADRVSEPNTMDPFYLAADIAQDFVLIHPFADGNGRMSRLLLNATLLKFAGCVCPLGVTAEARKQYLDVVKIAAEPVQEGKEADWGEMTGLREEEARCKLARLVLEGGRDCLQAMRDSVVRQQPDCQCTACADSAEQQQQSDDRSTVRVNSAEHEQRDARRELQILQHPNGMWIYGGPGAILPRYITLSGRQPPDGREAQHQRNGAPNQQLAIGGPQAVPLDVYAVPFDVHAVRPSTQPSQGENGKTRSSSHDEDHLRENHKSRLRSKVRARIRKIWYYGPFTDNPVAGDARKDFTPQEKAGMESRRREMMHERAERAKRKEV